MAYPSFRSTATTLSFSGSTVTVDTPAGAASGDVLTCTFIDAQGSRTLDTLPSGWTTIASAASSEHSGFWVCRKVLSGSPAASYDFTFSATFYGRAEMTAWQTGSDVSVAGSAAYAAAQSTSPYDIDAADITVPDNETLLVFIGGTCVTTDGNAPAHTPPSGFTERADVGLSYDVRAITIADKQVSSGSSGAHTGTVAWASAGNAYTVGVLLAIAPTGGSTQISLTGEANCPTVASVSASAASASVTAGNYYDVVVTVRDQEGAVLPGLTGSAASTDTGVATVALLAATDSSGQATLRITGVAVGSTTVTATFDGIASNSVPVTVVTGSSGSVVSISPSTATVYVGRSQQFTASANDNTGGYFGWSVQSGGGTITSTGLFTASNAAGTAVVRATYSLDLSMYSEAVVTVQSIAIADGVVTATWTTKKGLPLAGLTIDYWIISSDDELIKSGTVTTDSTGTFSVAVSPDYVGESVNVVMNNLAQDMSTAGKVQGQQVVIVT